MQIIADVSKISNVKLMRNVAALLYENKTFLKGSY